MEKGIWETWVGSVTIHIDRINIDRSRIHSDRLRRHPRHHFPNLEIGKKTSCSWTKVKCSTLANEKVAHDPYKGIPIISSWVYYHRDLRDIYSRGFTHG